MAHLPLAIPRRLLRHHQARPELQRQDRSRRIAPGNLDRPPRRFRLAQLDRRRPHHLLASRLRRAASCLPAGATALKPEAFSRIINTILENNKVTPNNINEHPPVRLSGDAATALGVPINRIIIEFSFEASPETVAAVLAELERTPEVAAVSRVKIDRSGVRGGANDDDRLVRATLSPEAWIVATSATNPSGDTGPGVVQ